MAEVKLEIRGEAEKALAALQSVLKKLDDLPKDAGKASVGFDKFFKSIESGAEKALGAFLKWGGALTAIVSGGGLAILAKQATEFQSAMANVATIAGQSAEQMRKLNNDVLELSKNSTKGPKDIAEGLYDAVSSGIEAGKAMDFMKVATAAATAGLSTTKDAVNAGTIALNTYGDKAGSVTEIYDAFFQTVNRGVITFPQLASSLGNVSTIANQSGVAFKDLMASIALVTKNGIQASEATTAMRALIQSIVAPTDEAKRTFQALHIEYGKGAIESKGLAGVIAQISEKTGGNAESLRKLIPEVNALTAAQILGKESGKAFREEIEAQEKAAGATAKAQEIQSQTVESAWARLKNTVVAQFSQAWAENELQIARTFDVITAGFREMKAADFAGLMRGLDAVLQALGKVAHAAMTAAGFVADLASGGERSRDHQQSGGIIVDPKTGRVIATGSGAKRGMFVGPLGADEESSAQARAAHAKALADRQDAAKSAAEKAAAAALADAQSAGSRTPSRGGRRKGETEEQWRRRAYADFQDAQVGDLAERAGGTGKSSIERELAAREAADARRIAGYGPAAEYQAEVAARAREAEQAALADRTGTAAVAVQGFASGGLGGLAGAAGNILGSPMLAGAARDFGSGALLSGAGKMLGGSAIGFAASQLGDLLNMAGSLTNEVDQEAVQRAQEDIAAAQDRLNRATTESGRIEATQALRDAEKRLKSAQGGRFNQAIDAKFDFAEKFIKNLVDNLPTLIKAIGDRVPDLVSGLVARVPELIRGILASAKLAIPEFLRAVVSEIVPMLPSIAVETVGVFLETLFASDFLERIVEGIGVGLYQMFGRLLEWLKGALSFGVAGEGEWSEKAEDWTIGGKAWGGSDGWRGLAGGTKDNPLPGGNLNPINWAFRDGGVIPAMQAFAGGGSVQRQFTSRFVSAVRAAHGPDAVPVVAHAGERVLTKGTTQALEAALVRIAEAGSAGNSVVVELRGGGRYDRAVETMIEKAIIRRGTQQGSTARSAREIASRAPINRMTSAPAVSGG